MALAGDRFLVRDLRPADDHFDLVIAGQAVAENFQVQLAHAGDDGLAGLFVVAGLEGRVFALEGGEGFAELLLVGGRLGLDRHADDRLGEGRPLEDDRIVRIAQRVAGQGFLHADTGDDVARLGDVDRIAVGGVHLEHAADVFALAAVAVEHAAALFQLAAVDADVGQIAVLIVDDLERPGRRTAHPDRSAAR